MHFQLVGYEGVGVDCNVYGIKGFSGDIRTSTQSSRLSRKVDNRAGVPPIPLARRHWESDTDKMGFDAMGPLAKNVIRPQIGAICATVA